MAYKVRVWDLPTRLFHWALAACIVGAVATGNVGGALMPWHARLGYAVLTLLLFRIAWGFVGGRWSRFSAFIYAPASVVNYLRGKAHPDHIIGHNPLGAAFIFVMMAVLLAQVATGLVGDDEISFTGPLNRFVTSSQGLAATWYHKRIGQWLVIGLALLHVAAILYYLLKKKDNLIKPMLNGDKAVATAAEPSRDDATTRGIALGVLAACAGVVAWVVNGGS